MLCASSIASADNYLFPTEVLPAGSSDIEVSAEKNSYSHAFDINDPVNFPGLTGHGAVKTTVVKESIQIRHGFENDWHIGIGLPHESLMRAEAKSSPGSQISVNSTAKGDGNENLRLWAKHRFVKNDDTPFSLSGSLEVDPSTANKHQTGVVADVAAGWRWNSGLEGFLIYKGAWTDRDQAPMSNGVAAGVYYQLTSSITLVPEALFTHYESTSNNSTTINSSTNQYGASLSAQWQVAQNSYLIPGFTYSHLDGYRHGAFVKYDDSNNGKTYALSFYHLF